MEVTLSIVRDWNVAAGRDVPMCLEIWQDFRGDPVLMFSVFVLLRRVSILPLVSFLTSGARARPLIHRLDCCLPLISVYPDIPSDELKLSWPHECAFFEFCLSICFW